MKPETLLFTNSVIATFSLFILYFFDSPIELIGATGIAWVLISSMETIRKLRKARKQTLAHEVEHHSFSQG